MNNLEKYIIEKLRINKDSQSKSNIKIDIKNTDFSEDEINKIISFANTLKIKPYGITNKIIYKDGEIINSSYEIKLYFYNNYLKISTYDQFIQTTDKLLLYISFLKFIDNTYCCKVYIGQEGNTNLSSDKVEQLDIAIKNVKNELQIHCKEYL